MSGWVQTVFINRFQSHFFGKALCEFCRPYGNRCVLNLQGAILRISHTRTCRRERLNAQRDQFEREEGVDIGLESVNKVRHELWQIVFRVRCKRRIAVHVKPYFRQSAHEFELLSKKTWFRSRVKRKRMRVKPLKATNAPVVLVGNYALDFDWFQI